MKAPKDATLVIRCNTKNRHTLGFVQDDTAYIAESLVVLTLEDGAPRAKADTLDHDSGFTRLAIAQERIDPTNLTAECKCGTWNVNGAQIALWLDNGVRGDVKVPGAPIRTR